MLVRTAGALGLGLLAASARPTPGDYHEGETLSCSDCHVMHPGNPPDDLAPEDPDVSSWVGALLREDVNDLCLSCHDGTASVSDVLGFNGGSGAGSVRQSGFLNRAGSSGLPATGHTLDSTDTAPGSTPPWDAELENGAGNGLNCINCHGHHGGDYGAASSYRNLRDDAGNNLPGEGLVTYNDGRPGSNDLSRDVFQRRERRYDERDVDFNEPDPNDSAMGRFCAGCHGEHHGAPTSRHIGGAATRGSFTGFLRHPTAGVDLGAGGEARSSLTLFASRTNRLKVMSELGIWDTPGPDVTPTCVTCHKAHGNGNAFGLILRSGTGVLTENGDTGGDRLENLCGQCHGAGLSG